MMVKAIVSPEVEEAILEAMNRLLKGTVQRTDGALTKVNLQIEAGISKATLFRAPHLLQLWDEQVGKRAGFTPGEFDREVKIKTLDSEVTELRAKVKSQDRTILGAKGIITALNVEIESLRAQIDTANRAKVTALRRR